MSDYKPQFTLQEPTKFRDSRNRLYTKALFVELAEDNKDRSIYTISRTDRDREGIHYDSLYRLFMELSDPTEYVFANKYFENWNHWQMIANVSWFKDEVSDWRKELEVKLRAEALLAVIEKSKSHDRDALTAAKYILDGNWKHQNTKGRPSKDQIREAARDIAEDQNRLDEDYERILNG